MDWAAAVHLIPEGCDRGAIIPLLQAWEQGMLDGVAEREKDKPR